MGSGHVKNKCSWPLDIYLALKMLGSIFHAVSSGGKLLFICHLRIFHFLQCKYAVEKVVFSLLNEEREGLNW